jgi:(R,R)-butanediol dehydrogenase / meso-butanediol dehydrogenase / diacetyl reductase
MKGLVFTGHRTLELMAFEDPTPADDEVILQIKASGFCGSDLHHYRGPRGASLSAKSPAFLAERGLTPDSPIIAGHEPCGVIVDMGRQVNRQVFHTGDRVMVYHYDGCRCCDTCRTGWVQMCDRGSTVYGHTAHGGHAHYMRVPARSLIRLPDSVSFAAGAAVSCGTGTAYAALERLSVSARDTLAVFGLGPVGLSAVQLARAMGVPTFAVDISDQRVATALALGASKGVNSAVTDPIDAIMEWTHGHGATVALDCSGVNSARQAAVRCTANWGRIAFVGVGGGVNLDAWSDLMARQRTLVGHWTFSDVGMSRCVQFVAEHGIDLDLQFTDRWDLTDAAEAYEKFDAQTSGKACFVF